MSDDAADALVEWWNDRVPMIEARIKEADDPDGKDTGFFWSQLIWQELVMWRQLGKPVDDAGLDFIVNRRGFTAFQRDFLIEGLEFLELRA